MAAGSEPLLKLKLCVCKCFFKDYTNNAPKKCLFKLGQKKDQTMHTFDCLIISFDSSVYCAGSAKEQKENEIKRLKGNFHNHTFWKMENVTTDSRAKPFH